MFVHVILMDMVQVAVMQIVNMVPVLYSLVTTVRTLSLIHI